MAQRHGVPLGTLLSTVSCLHGTAVSLAHSGEGLGARWGEEKTRTYLQRAGCCTIETHQLAHDRQHNWYVVRKEDRQRSQEDNHDNTDAQDCHGN